MGLPSSVLGAEEVPPFSTWRLGLPLPAWDLSCSTTPFSGLRCQGLYRDTVIQNSCFHMNCFKMIMKGLPSEEKAEHGRWFY